MSIKNNVVRTIKQLLGLLPSKLPTGVSEFNAWAQDIIDTYDLPTKDVESIRFTLSTIIMHLGPQAAYKAKFYFVLVLRASAAKQVAGQIFTDIKLAQKAAEEAAKKASESSNENKQ
jgi:hypothetical protein